MDYAIFRADLFMPAALRGTFSDVIEIMNAYLECFRWFATIKHIVNTCECPKISVYLWRESYAVSGE